MLSRVQAIQQPCLSFALDTAATDLRLPTTSRTLPLASQEMNNSQLLRKYKLVVLGGGGVGKSALTIQFIHRRYDDDYLATIEVQHADYFTKQVLIDDETALVEILDTAGQDEYRALREQYMIHGEGFVIVFSLNDRSSFDEIPGFYEQILRVKDIDPRDWDGANCNTPSGPAILLVGSKCDLGSRQVPSEIAHAMARRLGCSYIETSAKYSVNIDESFAAVVREIRRVNREQRHISTSNRSRSSKGLSSDLTSSREKYGYEEDVDPGCIHCSCDCVIG
ncbi:hypothetical protein MKEN_00003100 [Mycena kentingensis (nom. inval.)]|nr:hypothetical protein MKEN_00003100 [Mycena kentingensis (nom. inval.)]